MKRKCRFNDENDDLLSVKYYTKVNCIVDCKMNYAEKICGCRPWDYPTSSPQENDTMPESQARICDYFGSSCFNMALEDNEETQCNKKCISSCQEINYELSIHKEPIDPKNRICNFNGKPETMLELQIRKHILSQLSETNQNGDANYVPSTPPERRTLNLLRDVLSISNVSYFSDAEHAFEMDCQEKIKSDIAAVIVTMSSPTFTRMIRTPKATIFEKISAFGKL
jgi:hypothetical protein